MADAAKPRSSLGLKAGGEIHQLALRPQAVQRRRALLGLVDGGDASRVVAAVFQLTQALQQLGSRLPRADQGNDPAHGALITKKARLGRA